MTSYVSDRRTDRRALRSREECFYFLNSLNYSTAFEFFSSHLNSYSYKQSHELFHSNRVTDFVILQNVGIFYNIAKHFTCRMDWFNLTLFIYKAIKLHTFDKFIRSWLIYFWTYTATYKNIFTYFNCINKINIYTCSKQYFIGDRNWKTILFSANFLHKILSPHNHQQFSEMLYGVLLKIYTKHRWNILLEINKSYFFQKFFVLIWEYFLVQSE